MNTENLKINQVISKYSDLCSILEIKEAKAKKKIDQLKEVQRFLKFDKLGHKFIIKEIYNKPLPIINNKLKFSPFIEQLLYIKLIDFTLSNKDIVLKISKKKFLNELKKLNDNYVNNMKNELKSICSTEKIEELYSINDEDIKRNIEKALNEIRNRALGMWENSRSYYEIVVNKYVLKDRKYLIDCDNRKEYSINTSENKTVGIYAIRNIITNRMYIGSSIDIDGRLQTHINSLKENKHYNYDLQKEFNLYNGLLNLKFELLEVASDISQLPEKEYFWIKKYGGLGHTYNYKNPLEEYELIKKREEIKQKINN